MSFGGDGDDGLPIGAKGLVATGFSRKGTGPDNLLKT
jgi:hypothetical protein